MKNLARPFCHGICVALEVDHIVAVLAAKVDKLLMRLQRIKKQKRGKKKEKKGPNNEKNGKDQTHHERTRGQQKASQRMLTAPRRHELREEQPQKLVASNVAFLCRQPLNSNVFRHILSPSPFLPFSFPPPLFAPSFHFISSFFCSSFIFFLFLCPSFCR
jgi:hypothetical protein